MSWDAHADAETDGSSVETKARAYKVGHCWTLNGVLLCCYAMEEWIFIWYKN